MINLVEKDEKEELAVKRIKSIVWPITTTFLAGYLLLSSGMLGWWWWWNSRQKVTSTEAITLRNQLLAQQKNLLVSRVNDRVKFIDDYLSGRVARDKDLEFVRDDKIIINKWALGTTGVIEMEVAASTSAELDEYVKTLTQGYRTVNLDKVLWVAADGIWKADISLDKRKL